MTSPNDGLGSDLHADEFRLRKTVFLKEDLLQRRRAVVAELAALDHQLSQQRRASTSLLRLASVTAIFLGTFSLSLTLWGDKFPLSDLFLLVITLITVLAMAVTFVYALYRNRRLTAAFYETAASRFQREVARSWRDLDNAERELMELRQKIMATYDVEKATPGQRGDDVNEY